MNRTMLQGWKPLLCVAMVVLCSSPTTQQSIHLIVKVVRIGEDVTLTCYIDDNYINRNKLTIEWERPLGTVIGQGAELYLKNVQKSDVGSYICKATGVVDGRLVSKTVTEEVTISRTQSGTQNPPDIVISKAFNDTIILFETETLNINCKARNWDRDDYNVQWVAFDGFVTSENETLHIESLHQKKHEGTYACVIQRKNNLEEVFRKKVKLIVKVPQLSVEVLPTERLTIGGVIHRRCVGFQLSQSTETFTYTWMNPLGIVVSRSDMIHIPISSMAAQGLYTCACEAARNGRRYEISTEVKVDQTRKTGETSFAISITEMPAKLRLYEPLILRCAVTPSVKNIVYTWYKNNEFLQKGKTVDIKQFTKNDLGVYKCHAIGRTKTGKEIDLVALSFKETTIFNVAKHEMIEGRGTQVEVAMHKTKELSCYFSLDNGLSGKDVAWAFNDEELKTDKDFQRYRLVREDRPISSILHISSTNMDNEGRYTCSVGGVTKATNIIVKQESGILTIYPIIHEAFEGSMSEFHCKINNIPGVDKHNIQWHFVSKDGSERIELPNNRWRKAVSTVVEHTAIIFTDHLDMVDNGHIVCSIPSVAEDRAEIVVKTKIKPFIVTVSKPTITVRRFQRFEFDCFSFDTNGVPTGGPVLKFTNGSLLSTDSRFTITKEGPSKIRLVAPEGINIDDSQLQIQCVVGEKVTVVTIQLEEACPPQWRYCNSGECIDGRRFCDGIMDCVDGTDEDPKYCETCDPIRKPCSPHPGSNGTMEYFDIHTACDGVNNCKNGFDERNCPMAQKCNGVNFKCKDGLEIPYSYVCDGEHDCRDHEDEIGCREPTIIKISGKNVIGKPGSTVTLMCEAVGFPLPKIIWRYNWQCLPDPMRMVAVEESEWCRNVVSVLTIKDLRPGDDAEYTCEALSGTNRHLSQPINLSFPK